MSNSPEHKQDGVISVTFGENRVMSVKLPPSLMGYDRELAHINQLIERHRSAFILAPTEIGVDKTSLLQAVEARAVEHGWHTARCDNGTRIAIIPDMTPDDFCGRVLAILNDRTDEGSLAARTEHPSQPHSYSLWEQIRLFFEGLEELIYGIPRSDLADALFERLHETPVLLLIDGYQPEHSFARWFTRRFVANIRRTKGPAVVVVADQPLYVDSLKTRADEVVQLGSPDPQALERHLKSIGRQLTPPIEVEEVQVYIELLRERPELIASLIRVLTFAQTVKISPVLTAHER